jgi:hypothetical protein
LAPSPAKAGSAGGVHTAQPPSMRASQPHFGHLKFPDFVCIRQRFALAHWHFDTQKASVFLLSAAREYVIYFETRVAAIDLFTQFRNRLVLLGQHGLLSFEQIGSDTYLDL